MAVRPKTATGAASSAPSAQGASDALALGVRSMDSVTEQARQNVATLMAVTQVAVQGLEAASADLTAYSRESFERTTKAATAMTAATSPKDLLDFQTEHARQQIEATMAHMNKLSVLMFKTMRDVLARSAQR